MAPARPRSLHHVQRIRSLPPASLVPPLPCWRAGAVAKATGEIVRQAKSVISPLRVAQKSKHESLRKAATKALDLIGT